MSKEKLIETAIAQLNKELGGGTVNYLSKLGDDLIVEVIKTGIPSLDWVLGRGGIPLGKVIELFGEESGGKSFLLLELIAAAQKQGHMCMLIDAEQAFDEGLAKDIGVDPSTIVFSQEQVVEKVLRVTEEMILAGVKIVGIDSVAALIPQLEMDANIGDQTIALQARVLSQSMRRIVKVASDKSATVIFINQVRDKPGVFFGNPETTPGGRALKFYSSIRLRVNKLSKKEDVKKIGDEHYGHGVRVKVVKNKTAPPFRVTDLDLYFQEYKGIKVGIDKEMDLARFLIGKSYGQGILGKEITKDNVVEVAEQIRFDKDLRKKLTEEVEKIYVVCN